MTTRDFIYKALSNNTRKTFCSSVYAETDQDGNVTVYSYGSHYPLAKIINGKGFVNSKGYSNSTAKHINWAFSALGELIGYDNTYHAPLFDGNSLTPVGILTSATKEQARLAQEMASKKRKDTRVYEWLQTQHDRMTATIQAISN